MCAEKVHTVTQTSRSPVVAPAFTKTSRVPMVAPALLCSMKAALEPVIKLPLESMVAKRQQTLNKPVEKGVKSTMHKHTTSVTREKLKSSVCGKTCNKHDTIRLDSTKRGNVNHQTKAEFKKAGLTEPLSINEETDEKANCTIADVEIINSDVESLNNKSRNKFRNYSRCAASAAHDITQEEAAVPKTIGQPRQNVQALFSTLPVEQGFCGNVGLDKGIAHHSSLPKKAHADDKVNTDRCKYSAFETPLLLCSLRNEGGEVSAPTCDPTYQESIQRTSSHTRQDFDFHLESDRRNLNENGRLEFNGVQEAAVQTSPKTRNNDVAPSASVVDGSSNLDVLSMYFPSMFPDVNNPAPKSYSGFSFRRENNQLMEDLWQCLDDVERRQRVLNDNLDLSAHKRHFEEMLSFMEYLPTNPNIFKEKLSIKQRVEDYILSVRAEILSSVKEQLNAEKQAKVIKPPSFSAISTRGKRTCSGRGRNVSTGQLEIKPRATHEIMTRGASKSTSRPSLPKPPPPKAATKQRDAVPQHTPISMWSEESHRPVYGNLLGLGKQTREIRPYLHLKNPLPSQPVPWPPSPPPKSITGATTKPACCPCASQLCSPLHLNKVSLSPCELLNISTSTRQSMYHYCGNNDTEKQDQRSSNETLVTHSSSVSQQYTDANPYKKNHDKISRRMNSKNTAVICKALTDNYVDASTDLVHDSIISSMSEELCFTNINTKFEEMKAQFSKRTSTLVKQVGKRYTVTYPKVRGKGRKCKPRVFKNLCKFKPEDNDAAQSMKICDQNRFINICQPACYTSRNFETSPKCAKCVKLLSNYGGLDLTEVSCSSDGFGGCDRTVELRATGNNQSNDQTDIERKCELPNTENSRTFSLSPLVQHSSELQVCDIAEKHTYSSLGQRCEILDISELNADTGTRDNECTDKYVCQQNINVNKVKLTSTAEYESFLNSKCSVKANTLKSSKQQKLNTSINKLLNHNVGQTDALQPRRVCPRPSYKQFCNISDSGFPMAESRSSCKYKVVSDRQLNNYSMSLLPCVVNSKASNQPLCSPVMKDLTITHQRYHTENHAIHNLPCSSKTAIQLHCSKGANLPATPKREGMQPRRKLSFASCENGSDSHTTEDNTVFVPSLLVANAKLPSEESGFDVGVTYVESRSLKSFKNCKTVAVGKYNENYDSLVIESEAYAANRCVTAADVEDSRSSRNTTLLMKLSSIPSVLNSMFNPLSDCSHEDNTPLFKTSPANYMNLSRLSVNTKSTVNYRLSEEKLQQTVEETAEGTIQPTHLEELEEGKSVARKTHIQMRSQPTKCVPSIHVAHARGKVDDATHYNGFDSFAAGDSLSNLKPFSNHHEKTVGLLLHNVTLSPTSHEHSNEALCLNRLHCSIRKHKRNFTAEYAEYSSNESAAQFLKGMLRDDECTVPHCKADASGDWFSKEEIPSRLKINPFTQAVGLSLSQKSQTIASNVSKDERSVLQEDLASGQAEVKGTKPRVTFLDDNVTSVVPNPETENKLTFGEMLISSLESSEHEPSSIEDSYAHVLNSTMEDSFHQEGSSENLNKNEEGESDNVNSNLTSSARSSPELEAAPEVNISGTNENSEKWPEDCDNQIEVILESDGVAMQNSTTTQQQLGQGINDHTADDVMLSSKTTDFSKAAVEAPELNLNELQEVVGFRDHCSSTDGLSPKQNSPSIITQSLPAIKNMPSDSTREFTMKNSSQPNTALPSGLTSSEQYLNEAKYWIEQELLARSLSLLFLVEEVKRPDPSVTRVPLLTQQPQEENWLMGIIGAEGAKLFMEAGTSIDEELICKLVKDVISEQAVAYILANRKLNSKKELPSDASPEASSQSYSKDSFVSESDSQIEKSEEVQEIVIDEEPKEDQPLDTPVVTPVASPVGSRLREVIETAVEVLPQFIQDPIRNPSVDRPVTPTFSDSASENETEERLPGGGLWASESDPMHRNGANPSSPADTPRATPSPQPEVPLIPLEQVHPPTTPQLSSTTESLSGTGAAPVAPSALWNQGTQTSPRVGPLGNQLASDGQQAQTDRPVEHPLPQRTISHVDQGVGSSPPPSIETINSGIEDTQVDFDLSEGEWLMYQHQVQRLLPFARYGAQHSSTQFSVSRGSGGSMDNTLLDSEELERDPISEGEIPLSFSPEWVTSMLALIAELQSSGQVLGPSASSDAAAFIARARNLGSGSTSRLPSPGEVSTPHAVLHHHSRQPSRLSTAIHSASQVASTTAFGVVERVRFPYAESFTRRNPVPLVDIINDDRQHQDIESVAIHDRQHGTAELSFVACALSAPESPVGVPYLEPLVSEGELRSSVVPTGSHQSEPDHSQSSIVIEPSTTLKRSSSTPSTSIKSISQRRYSGAIPSRSQAIGTATMTSAITAAVSATTYTSVSQPLLTHRDSSVGSRALPDHAKTGTERESDLHSAPVYRLAAAREEIAISLPPGSPLATSPDVMRSRRTSPATTSADVMRSRRTSPAINYGTDRHVDNVALTTATSGEGGNEAKSSKANATSQLKDITDSPSKLATDAALLSPGQVSSPNPSPPPAVNISASSSASEGEARLC